MKFSCLLLLLLLQACSITTHPLGAPAPGKSATEARMESLIDVPGPVRLDTFASADWSVALSGLVNLKSPEAAGIKDRDEPIQVYAHLLRHPQFGNYLVDTGVSQKLQDDPGAFGLNWAIRHVMHIEKLKINKSTEDILQGADGKLSGVFFTHLHLDHISGMPAIADDVPLYVGPLEATKKNLMNLFTQGVSDSLLEHKSPLQEWPFSTEGIIDIFGDGSVFAISVPGHTPGSTAYLVRTERGPVLLTGDTCHTRWGWEHTVEPGDFTEDHARNLESLKRLKALVAHHPAIEVRLGHQH